MCHHPTIDSTTVIDSAYPFMKQPHASIVAIVTLKSIRVQVKCTLVILFTDKT